MMLVLISSVGGLCKVEVVTDLEGHYDDVY